MQITDVLKNQKVKDMLSIYIDGEFGFTIREEDYLSMGLYDKKEITAEEIKYIKNDLNFRYAKQAAIKYLALKLRTQHDVVKKLEKEGFDVIAITKAIDELKAMGYINDHLYAQKYLYDRSRLKPKSKKMLVFELQSKGIPEETAQNALNEFTFDDTAVAEGLLRKKYGKYDLNDEVIFKRAYFFLKHRGFSDNITISTIRKLQNDE